MNATCAAGRKQQRTAADSAVHTSLQLQPQLQQLMTSSSPRHLDTSTSQNPVDHRTCLPQSSLTTADCPLHHHYTPTPTPVELSRYMTEMRLMAGHWCLINSPGKGPLLSRTCHFFCSTGSTHAHMHGGKARLSAWVVNDMALPASRITLLTGLKLE